MREVLQLALSALTCAGSHAECESLERCAVDALRAEIAGKARVPLTFTPDQLATFASRLSEQAMQIINAAWMALPETYRVEHDDDPTGNPLPSAVRALAAAEQASRTAQPTDEQIAKLKLAIYNISQGDFESTDDEARQIALAAGIPAPAESHCKHGVSLALDCDQCTAGTILRAGPLAAPAPVADHIVEANKMAPVAEPDAFNRRLRAQLEQEWCDLQSLKAACAAAPPAKGAPAQPALARFKELDADKSSELATETPLERLRFFCSLALQSQDWLDVEPFFDALSAQQAPLTDAEITAAQKAINFGYWTSPTAYAQAIESAVWAKLGITAGPTIRESLIVQKQEPADKDTP